MVDGLVAIGRIEGRSAWVVSGFSMVRKVGLF